MASCHFPTLHPLLCHAGNLKQRVGILMELHELSDQLSSQSDQRQRVIAQAAPTPPF